MIDELEISHTEFSVFYLKTFPFDAARGEGGNCSVIVYKSLDVIEVLDQ